MSLTNVKTEKPKTHSPWHKRARLLGTYLAGRPVWCSWQVTYRCNFGCSFCNYWQTPSHPDSELTLAEFALGGRRLAQWGSLLISLGGGEPLLRPDIVDIVGELARHHFVLITTNGWLVTPALARRLFEAGLWGVSVSLDYADPARHDRQRGRPGAYQHAFSALRAFAEARTGPQQRVNLMCVLVHDNVDDLPPLAQAALDVGANLMVQPYSPLKTGESTFLPQVGVRQRLQDLHRRFPNFLSHPRFLARFDEALDGGVAGCRAGQSFFNIDESGQVGLCVERRHRPLGNLLGDDLAVIERRLRRAARRNHCQACWYNCRGEVEALYDLRGFLGALPTYLLGPRAETVLRGLLGGRGRPHAEAHLARRSRPREGHGAH